MPVGLPEFVDNPEPRCPVILLCDTPSSMSLRVEVALVTFGLVRLAQDFVTIDNNTSRFAN